MPSLKRLECALFGKSATVQFPDELLATKAPYVHIKYPHHEMLRLFDPTSSLAGSLKRRVGLEICVPPSSGGVGSTSQKDKVMGLLEALSDSSSLQQLRLIFICETMDLRNNDWSLAGGNPFARLTHISISGDPTLHDCIAVLSHCTSAVQAQFGTVSVPTNYYDTDPSNYASITRTRLPQLRSLTLSASSDADAFLPYFDCPELLRFLMSNGPVDLTGDDLKLSRYHLPAILEFLSRSSKLKQVVIVDNTRWMHVKPYFDSKRCGALLDIPIVDIRAYLPLRGRSEDAELPHNVPQFQVCKHREKGWAHVSKGGTGKLLDVHGDHGAPFWDRSDGNLQREWMDMVSPSRCGQE